MKLLWNYLQRYRKLLAGALGLAVINQVFSLLDPQIFRIIVDQYASRIHEYSRSGFIRGVLLLLLASVTVALISRIAKNFQDYYVNVIVQRLGTALYSDSVAHSFSLPYVAFEDQRSGELLRKLEKARTDSQALVTSMINTVFFSLVGIIFVLVYATTVHWAIGLTYFLMIPVLGFITFFISRKIKAAQKRIVTESASLAGSTTETLRNVELVKSLGLETQEIGRLNTVNEQILQLELKKVVLVRKLSFIQGTAINAIRSVLLLLMLYLVYRADITLGQFFSIFVYSFFIFSPLAELGTVATNYQEARASLEKLSEVFTAPVEVRPNNPVHLGRVQTIEFRDVGFQYASSAIRAVRGINLTARAGETVAFVGPSGAGKSTLVKLLAGLYRPTTGTVLVNGTEGSRIDFTDLRKRIGLVAQETQLFAGSIRENLLFVNPGATDEECMQALRAAAADTIISRGNRGLDTRIGEGGIKLSGGERQRLAIARALLRRPELMIFDEATSSLDSITERSITETIRQVEQAQPDLIRVIIAHRLSTVAHATRIYVLERGALVEQGTHAELLAAGGLYAALWREQVTSAGVV
ncbi:MAG: ABC transporter ATP-binding protein [Patescibacteria group bacterium]